MNNNLVKTRRDTLSEFNTWTSYILALRRPVPAYIAKAPAHSAFYTRCAARLGINTGDIIGLDGLIKLYTYAQGRTERYMRLRIKGKRK